MSKIITILLVILMVSSASATTVSLVPIEEGQPGSATNPLQPSDIIRIYATTDAGLLALDAVLTISSGSGWITDAIGSGIGIPSLPYGWDPGFSFPPIISPDGQSVEIGLGTFGGSLTGIVAWFEIRSDSDGPGQLVVDLSGGTGFGGSADLSFAVPTIDSTLIIYQVPEPATIALLGFGGMCGFALRYRGRLSEWQ